MLMNSHAEAKQPGIRSVQRMQALTANEDGISDMVSGTKSLVLLLKTFQCEHRRVSEVLGEVLRSVC